MQKRRLVVVDRDAWVRRALADGADGFDFVECREARAGLNACCALEPDCLLTAIRPGDPEGLWLIQAIRAQHGEIGALPLVAMASRSRESAPSRGAEEPLQVQALRAGADVVLQKPLDVDEVLAQVEALIAMAARVRVRRRALPGPDGAEVLAGHLDEMPVTSILCTLELRRQSGELVLATRGAVKRRLSLLLASGTLIGGQLDTSALTPVEAMRLALGWEGSRFEFMEGSARTPFHGATMGELLLEALHGYAPTTWRDLLDGVDLPAVSPRSAELSPPQTLRQQADGTSLLAPGQRLVESVVPSPRADPRVEVDAAQGADPRR